MSFYDKLTEAIGAMVALVSPARATQYLQFHKGLKKQRDYASGKTTGVNEKWNPGSTTADREIGKDWRKTTDRVRDLERNNPFVTGAMMKHVAFTVGEGLWPTPKVKDREGKLNKDINAELQKRFYKWSEQCQADGGDWQSALELISRHLKQDGEIIVVLVSQPSYPFFTFQLLEPDQIDKNVDGWQSNGNLCVRGIELNKYAKPVAYHLLQYHPGSTYSATYASGSGINETKRVPAENIIHLYNKKRVSQNRGICDFAASVMPIYDLDQYRNSTMDVLRIAASYGIFIESPYPGDYTENLPSRVAGVDADGNDIYEKLNYINPAGIHYLRVGEKPQALKPEVPNAQYKDFEASCLRGAADGFGQSFETFSGDYSAVNYSSARLARLIEQSLFRMVTSYIERKFCIPIYRMWLEYEVQFNGLSLPRYQTSKEMYQEVKFSRPPMPWVDPEKEANAAVTMIQNGLASETEIIEQRGRDLQDVLEEIADAQKRRKELGIKDKTETMKPKKGGLNNAGNTDKESNGKTTDDK